MSFSFPYHFVFPSEEEKVHRRELIDLRGSYAQWSVIVVIVALRAIQSWNIAIAQASGTSQPHRRPISWWDRPPIPGWLETRRQHLVCGLWLLWLVSLSIWNSGDDYLHLTKALGHVGLSQIPLQVLMSPAAYITSKPSASSVLSFVTSIPQGTLTPYHRLFGRLVISPLLFSHATLYLLFFVQSEHPEFGILLAKRVQDLDVQCGLVALSAAIALLLFARPRGVTQKGDSRVRAAGSMQNRKRSFYFVHVSLVVVLCFAAYFHVHQARFYMVQTLGASVLNSLCSLAMVRFEGL
ncbi:hypothetical protein N7495_005846 [Penicillium taxi]|uniref:uncharacterized protein n=1 Tax=Penicillium taxi TaxID=168475 RepID=UPI002545AF07|nr:uncharacterized protein N7495_005846 [Penicillium taxi]KAJ5894155.1 hypothetical protein N7495_005846 [Penicillium taxi]